METICLNLIEAKVTLYPANADGTPQLNSPIWIGVHTENLHGIERWLKRQTMPSGAPYPRNHPLVPVYEVTLGRVWALQETAPAGWQTQYTQYVLDILWTEEETREWHRKTFYWVTINERSWEAKDVENGLMENQIFDAQYMAVSGGGEAPPPISSSLPYTVVYTDATGSTLIYTYDPDTNLFTAVGNPAALATISYTAGAFAVQFALDDTPVLSTTVNSLLYRNSTAYRNSTCYNQAQFRVRGGIFSGIPLPTELPRLDFYYGPTRLCSVTQNGLYDVNFDELDPAAGTGKVGILSGSNLIATLAAGEVDAKNFIIV